MLRLGARVVDQQESAMEPCGRSLDFPGEHQAFGFSQPLEIGWGRPFCERHEGLEEESVLGESVERPLDHGAEREIALVIVGQSRGAISGETQLDFEQDGK